jgi:integrase
MTVRRQKVKTSTANASLTIMKHMFRMAEEWGYLAEGSNPARKLKREKVRNCRDRYLSPEEVKTLLESCTDWLPPIVLTALHSGGRRAEVLGLEWSALDFAAEALCFRDTKNADVRKVPMSAQVRDTLKALPNRLKGGRVFLRGDEPVSKHVLRDGFDAAVKKAGLDGFRLHDCRHTWATHLAMDGLPLRTLQELGGWRRPEMVQRYAAVTPASRQRAAAALNRIFGSTPATSPQQGPKTGEGESS